MDLAHPPPQLLPFLLHPSPQISGLTLVNLLPYTVQSSPYRNLILNSKSAPDGERGWLKVFAGISRGSKDEVRLLCALSGHAQHRD